MKQFQYNNNQNFTCNKPNLKYCKLKKNKQKKTKVIGLPDIPLPGCTWDTYIHDKTRVLPNILYMGGR